MDKVSRRCDICNYFEHEGGSNGRKFVHDPATHQLHCMECAGVIRDDLGYSYWITSPALRDQQDRGRQEAHRRAKERREFRGYAPGEIEYVDSGFERPMETDGDPLWGISPEPGTTSKQPGKEGQGSVEYDTSIPGPSRGTGGVRKGRVLPPRIPRGWSPAPTSADLDAIEREMDLNWEDVLKDMDLESIE